MPRDLPVGNGNLLINFDGDYNLRDIYYPYVGKANHSNRCISRTGVWVDGQMSWLSDPKWKKDMRYVPDTLSTNVTASNPTLKLRLVFQDLVDFRRDVFLRRVEVTNLGDASRSVRLFFHYDFLFWGVGSGDAIHYHPEDRSLVAYKDDCYFLINACVDHVFGASSWSMGHKDESGKGGSWADAEDGHLEEIPNSFGSIDGIIAVDMPDLAPQQGEYCNTWMAASNDLKGVRLLDYIVEQRGPQYFITRTMNYWRAWVYKEDVDFHDLPLDIVSLYRQSLLILRTQIDNRGGIMAANDSDQSWLVHGRETYSYVWPRDGAYIANALDEAGYAFLAANFYDFCKDVIHYEPQRGNEYAYQDKAYMLHKYTPDKLIASNWMPEMDDSGVFRPPIQEDETALVPYALWRHYLKFRDLELLKPWFRSLVIHTANFMVDFRDERTGLPAPSFDLWEERTGIYSFTAATVWAGLTAAAELADLLGELDDSAKFRRAAAEIKSACEEHLYDESEGRFLKGLSVDSDGNGVPIRAVDASLYGLWYFGMFSPHDPRIERTMAAVVDQLTCHTEVGGLARYVGDEYHWDSALDARRDQIPGNPWVISTLWLAQYHIARAQTIDELHLAVPIFEWTQKMALPSGVLAEQFHPLTGEHLSVSPLTWSHAMLVAAVGEYIQKYEALS